MIRVQGVIFEPDGMTITFIDVPGDIRVKGHATVYRQIRLSADHPDYNEDMELLQRQAVRAVANGLEDWTESEPYDPEADQEDPDSDKGMGER